MDKIKCLINMIIAYLIYPFNKRKFKNRNIWLVGGNAGELFVDNGRAMYEYLRSRQQEEVYWVINRNAKIAKKIPGEKLIKGSVKSYLYFMNAKVALFSHSISADIVPYLFVVPLINKFHKKVFKVFLNHGTVGFKVRQAMNPKTAKVAEALVKSYDLNICDSEFEKKVKTETWWEVPKETAVITGYPRYDKLYNLKIMEKQIFFMPTWRNWLKSENSENQKFEDTKYFQNIANLITDKKLNNYLEKNDIKLNIYIHQLMQDYLKNFGNIKLGKNIKILPKEVNITEELQKSKLLITDYSSVAYDFYYLNKPIIFFQFDKREYEEKVGSYVDLDKDLFGKQAKTVEKCVEEIIEISENNFHYDKEMKQKSDKLKEKLRSYVRQGKNLIFRNEDANSIVKEMGKYLIEHKTALKGLVLLDPFGMNLNWDTISSLKGAPIDLWILVPSGVIINRLLERDGSLKHIEKLKQYFGLAKEEIENRFYIKKKDQTLFGEIEKKEKVKGPIKKIAALYVERLNTLFHYVTNEPLVMTNTRGVPIFHFVFASNNKNAMNIAQQIISKKSK